MTTDLVLRSYRDGLCRETAGSPGRVWDLGRCGLDLGIRRIDEESFLRRVGSGRRATSPGSRRGRAPPFSAEGVRRVPRGRGAPPGAGRGETGQPALQRPAPEQDCDAGGPGTARGDRVRVSALSRPGRRPRAFAQLSRAGPRGRPVLQAAHRAGDRRGQSSEVLSTARKADWGSSTSPTIFIRFLPSFCFSSSLLFREMSPP